MRYLVLVARLIIGGLFVYASLYKIQDPAAFAISIRNYGILPAEWSNVAALALPWIEVVAGSFLILGVLTRPSALLTSGMLAVFLSAIIYAYATGLDIDCGCFSSAASSPGRVGIADIFRDASLFAISLLILVGDQGHFSVGGRATRQALTSEAQQSALTRFDRVSQHSLWRDGRAV